MTPTRQKSGKGAAMGAAASTGEGPGPEADEIAEIMLKS